EGYQTYVINDAVLAQTYQNYPILWKDPDAQPTLAIIGCPHLALSQIYSTVDRIDAELEKAGRQQVRLKTVLTSAPKVIAKFKEDKDAYARLLSLGLHLSHACSLMHMNNPVAAQYPVLTNSNKLRTYTTARFFMEPDVLHQTVYGDNASNEGQMEAQAVPGHGLPIPIADHRPIK